MRNALEHSYSRLSDTQLILLDRITNVYNEKSNTLMKDVFFICEQFEFDEMIIARNNHVSLM